MFSSSPGCKAMVSSKLDPCSLLEVRNGVRLISVRELR
jgi:hypothetical protein